MAFVDPFIDPAHDDAPAARQYAMTDLACATRVHDEWGHKLRYCQAQSTWYVYSDGKWQRESLMGSQRMITETLVRQRIAHPEHQGDPTSASFVKKVTFHAMAMLAIAPEDFDRVYGVINFKNGVLDLRTGELMDHSPGLFLTQQVNYEWRPGADYSLWKKHLSLMFHGDEELVDLFQLLVGMSLWGAADRDQLFIHLKGKGRNGKGVALRMIGKALGNYYLSAPINLFSLAEGSHSTEYMSLKGTRFVGCSEMGTGKLNVGVLKMLTGGDQVTARAIRANPVTFDNTWVLFLATNYALNTTGDAGDALWERYLPLQCGEPIPEAMRDNLIEQKLDAEVMSSGIMRWMVDGCLMWQEMGQHIPIPDKVRAWRGEERESSDVFGSFIDEVIDVTYDQSHKITLQQLAIAFETWRIANNENLRMSSKLISADLRSRYGLTVKAGAGNRRTAFGLRFKQGDGTGTGM